MSVRQLSRMRLRVVFDKDQGKIDHLAIFGLNGHSGARSIEGHQRRRHGTEFYDAYPVDSFWAIVSTIPELEMSPGARKLWDRINGDRESNADVRTPRGLEVPRLMVHKLPPNREGHRGLRPAQELFVERALHYKRYLGALDTRVGKTLTYACIHLKVQEGRDEPTKSLIIMPTRVKWTIWNEIETYIEDPMMDILDGDRGTRESKLDTFLGDPEAEILLTGYEALASHIHDYHERLNDGLTCRFVDESHYCKDEHAKRSQAVRSLDTEYRILGTATPTPNGLYEIYSQLNDLNPDFFPCRWSGAKMVKSGRPKFEATYCEKRPIQVSRTRKVWQIVGYKPEVRELRAILDTYMLRVKYSDVVDQMPEVTEQWVDVELETKHAALYESLRKSFKEEAIENEFKDLRAMALRLRQAAVHPSLLPGVDTEWVGTKIQESVDLREMLDEPVVMVSYFPEVARRLADLLGDRCALVLSDMAQDERFEVMKKFQAGGDKDTYVSTIGITKEGIKLSAANVMICIDDTYVPADKLQLTRRLFDIDKADPITIYNLSAHGTIDSAIRMRREGKQMEISLWIDNELPSEVENVANQTYMDAVKSELMR